MTYRYRVTLPWSEVCMHMKIAGQEAEVEALPGNMAQIYLRREGGGARAGVEWYAFSFPVTRWEAGLTDEVINRHRAAELAADRVAAFMDRYPL